MVLVLNKQVCQTKRKKKKLTGKKCALLPYPTLAIIFLNVGSLVHETCYTLQYRVGAFKNTLYGISSPMRY